jgi:hypothetical protein
MDESEGSIRRVDMSSSGFYDDSLSVGEVYVLRSEPSED